jgi:hypothetical protein
MEIIIAALGGSIIGGAISLIGIWLNNRSLERRHRRELIIKTSVDYWLGTANLAKEINVKTGLGVTVSSLFQNILIIKELDKLINEGKFDKRRIKEFIKKAKTIKEQAQTISSEVKTEKTVAPEGHPRGQDREDGL